MIPIPRLTAMTHDLRRVASCRAVKLPSLLGSMLIVQSCATEAAEPDALRFISAESAVCRGHMCASRGAKSLPSQTLQAAQWHDSGSQANLLLHLALQGFASW